MTLLCAALIFTAVPLSASADSAGDLTVTGGILATDYSYDEGQERLTILTDTPMTISGTTEKDVVWVAAGVTANITIDNLSISIPRSKQEAAFEIMENASLNLTVLGANTLRGGEYRAGLSVRNTALLVITDASTGALDAYGGFGAAGIGGNFERQINNTPYTGGTIIINAGAINAAAGIDDGTWRVYFGAGIGSGVCGKTDNAAHITINGGIVKAVCKDDYGNGTGAAIGGGYNCRGSFFWINGGTVEATGDHVGIGGGVCNPGGKLLIKGGTVKVNEMGASVFYDDDYEKTAYPTLIEFDSLNDIKKIDFLAASLDGADYSYGIKDVFTDALGNLYLYLPLNTVVSGAKISGQLYAGAVTTTDDAQTSSGKLYPGTVITASAATGGSISPVGETYVIYGDNQTYTVTPDSGYCVASVEVDGSNVGALSSYTFPSVDSEHTINAVFGLNPINSSAGSTIYLNGRTTLTPPVGNGHWNFNEEIVSLETHSDGTATVTALQEGTTEITYTFNDFSVGFSLTILKSKLPSTGQDNTLVWVLIAIAVLCAAGAVIIGRYTLNAKNKKA